MWRNFLELPHGGSAGRPSRKLTKICPAMENFCIGHSETVEFATDSYHYGGGWVDGSVLCSGATRLALPFAVEHFRAMQYDYLLISAGHVLYRVNKCRMAVEEVGALHGPAMAVETGRDSIVIVGEEELFVFNAYFDLVASRPHAMALRRGARCRIVWADDLFCVLTDGGSFTYSLGLELLHSNRPVSSAVFISRYNKFACAVDGLVRFIEPNGLEHGDPLPASCEELALLRVDGEELLLAISAGRIEAFYMKNFYWYKKLAIAGAFLCCEENKIVLRQPRSVALLYIYREMADGFVIDGCVLKYTNLSAALIPPPYFYKAIELGSQVDSYARAGDRLYVLAGQRLHRYRLEDDCLYLQGTDSPGLPETPNEMAVVGGCLLLRCGNEIYALENGRARCLLSLPGPRVVRMCDIGGQIGVLLADGSLGRAGPPSDACPRSSLQTLHRFRFDVRKSFKLEVHTNLQSSGRERRPARAYFLSDGALQTADLSSTDACAAASRHCTPRGGDVISFLVHKQYLIYTSKDRLVIEDGGLVCGRAYADPGQSLLGVHGGRIISQTRFGSLEATSSKVFGREQVKEHIAAGRYREAASICDSSHIGYEIFYDGGKCPASLVDALDDRQVLSLVRVLEVDGPVLHENDSIERLRMAFRPEMIYEDYAGRGGPSGKDRLASCFISGDSPGPFIRSDSVKHLFATPYHDALIVLPCAPAQQGPASDAILDTGDVVGSINAILRRLVPDRHPNAIVGLFIHIGRPDLCFYLPSLHRVSKMLVGLISTDDILKAAVRTLSMEKIGAAYKACQSDVLPFAAFYNSCSSLEHSIYDYLEEREKALYYLVRAASGRSFVELDGMGEDVRDGITGYVERHGLFDQLLMYQYYGIFNINFYPYVARRASPEKAFVLCMLGGDRKTALDIAYKNVLWREALGEFAEAEARARFIGLLVERGRYSEVGEIYDEHVKDYEKAIEYYMMGACYGGAVGAWRKLRCMGLGRLAVGDGCGGGEDKENAGGRAEAVRDGSMLIDLSRVALKNEIVKLDELAGSFGRYKERIGQVRQRLNENIELSQTSHSHSSLKTVRNALVRDRPGGAYEHEYVLNRLRETVLGIVEWRSRTESLLEIFAAFGADECRDAHARAFSGMGRELRSEVERLWEFRRHDYDPNRPVIEKPLLTAYFE